MAHPHGGKSPVCHKDRRREGGGRENAHRSGRTDRLRFDEVFQKASESEGHHTDTGGICGHSHGFAPY